MKEIEVAISGKPGKWGSESIGINDETLKTRLYNQCQRDSTVESRMVVCFGNSNGESYSYYHYQKPQKVAQKRSKNDIDNMQKHGRTGSYFCLTLRFNNSFCNDFKFIYMLLEEMFVQYIENHVLSCEDTDGFWEYQIAELSEAESWLIKIEDELNSIILNNQNKIEQFSFLVDKQQVGGTILLNLESLNQEECFKQLNAGEELYISPDYCKEAGKEDSSHVISNETTLKRDSKNSTETEYIVSPQFSTHIISDDEDEQEKEPTSVNNLNIEWKDKWNGLIKYIIVAIILFGILVVPFCKFYHKDIVEIPDTTKHNFMDNKKKIKKTTSKGISFTNEPHIITNIDIKGTNYFVKGECYKITAIAIANTISFPAVGFGKFEVNNPNIWLHQDSAICAVYIPIHFNRDTVKIIYHYTFENNDTSFVRHIAVKNK